MSRADFAKAAQDLNRELLAETATRNPDLWRVQNLLDRGANLETRDADGRTPLLLAIANDATDAALFLIGSGANINAADSAGETPLLYAADRRNLTVLKPLLERNAQGSRGGGSFISGEMWDRHIEYLREEIVAADKAVTTIPVLKPFALRPRNG